MKAAWFTSLGDLGGGYGSGGGGISGNGSVAVGVASSLTGTIYKQEAFRWSQATGMVGLGDLSRGSLDSEADATSFDGSVVVGQASPASGDRAFYWTAGTGMVSLGLIDAGSTRSVAADVSADGGVVVGGGDSTASNTLGDGEEAFRWTQATGMVGLGDLPGGIFSSNAEGISGDGNVVVGSSKSASGREAFRWTQATGMVGLGDLDGGTFDGVALAASADGSVIVGAGDSSLGTEMFRWTEATGMVGLGNMGGTIEYSEANDVSADGSVIVGTGDTVSSSIALIWDPENGLQSIQDLLIGAGIDLTGWQLFSADGISEDGKIIVGSGTNPDGITEAWVANLSNVPIPSAAWLFSSGLLGLIGILRHNRAVDRDT